jgi:hypothetical protein
MTKAGQLLRYAGALPGLCRAGCAGAGSFVPPLAGSRYGSPGRAAVAGQESLSGQEPVSSGCRRWVICYRRLVSCRSSMPSALGPADNVRIPNDQRAYRMDAVPFG